MLPIASAGFKQMMPAPVRHVDAALSLHRLCVDQSVFTSTDDVPKGRLLVSSDFLQVDALAMFIIVDRLPSARVETGIPFCHVRLRCGTASQHSSHTLLLTVETQVPE
jgi:hypothetical protein